MYVIVMVKFEEVSSREEAIKRVEELDEFCPDHKARIEDALLHNDKGIQLGRIYSLGFSSN